MKQIDVKRSQKFPDGIALIYTKEEAIHYGIKFLPFERWRHAQYGQYAETVDGFVTPIIKRNDSTNNPHIKTPTGCFSLNRPGTIFDTKEFYNRNSYTRKSRWNGKSTKLTSNQFVFFDVLSRTCSPRRALDIAYPNFKRESDKKAFLSELLRSKLFEDFMNKFRDKFIEAGITEEVLIDKLAELIPRSSAGTFPALAKMAAVGLGAPEMFEADRQLESGKDKEKPLFSKPPEDADFEDVEQLKLAAVRD